MLHAKLPLHEGKSVDVAQVFANTMLRVTLQFAGKQVSGCGTSTIEAVLHMKLPLQERQVSGRGTDNVSTSLHMMLPLQGGK